MSQDFPLVELSGLGPEYARDGREVTLRPATMDDAEAMFQWQTDDRTRRYARNPAKPTRDEHVNWLQRYLANPNGHLCIILHNGEASGILRLDREGDCLYEVTVITSPKKYRHGVAIPALNLARHWFANATLVAEVLPGNEASRRMLVEAGYREVSDGHYAIDPLRAGPATAGTIQS